MLPFLFLIGLDLVVIGLCFASSGSRDPDKDRY